MNVLFNTQDEIHRIEVYNEYLKKIPDLLKQLDTVEKMYQKALLEEKMMEDKDSAELSVALYNERLARNREQCEKRAADIREQLKLIFALKAQIEAESSVLRELM